MRNAHAFLFQVQSNQYSNYASCQCFRLNDQHIDIQSKKDQEIEEGVKMVAEKNKEMCVLNDEIAALKEAYAHGPSVSLKNMVERLRHQLALKDQQHQVRLCDSWYGI